MTSERELSANESWALFPADTETFLHFRAKLEIASLTLLGMARLLHWDQQDRFNMAASSLQAAGLPGATTVLYHGTEGDLVGLCGGGLHPSLPSKIHVGPAPAPPLLLPGPALLFSDSLQVAGCHARRGDNSSNSYILVCDVNLGRPKNGVGSLPDYLAKSQNTDCVDQSALPLLEGVEGITDSPPSPGSFQSLALYLQWLDCTVFAVLSACQVAIRYVLEVQPKGASLPGLHTSLSWGTGDSPHLAKDAFRALLQRHGNSGLQLSHHVATMMAPRGDNSASDCSRLSQSYPPRSGL